MLNRQSRALNWLMMLSLIVMMGCSKSNPGPNPNPTPVDLCPLLPGVQTDPSLCPYIPPPTGTVTANITSIPYNDSVEFTYAFNNVNYGTIGGVQMPDSSGKYTFRNLKVSTTFTVSLNGKNGTTVALPSIIINVGQDPRITFLTTGILVHDSTIARQLGGVWFSGPNGTINNYTYFYNGFNGPPGNNATAVNGTNPINFFWYFIGANGFWAHGIECDQFVITGANTFKTHEYGTVIIGGVPADGEYWRSYKRQ